MKNWNKFMLGMAAMSIFSTLAYAEGEKAGNGGNAGVCFNSAATVQKIKAHGNQISNSDLADIASIEALDLYEAMAQFPEGTGEKELFLPNPEEYFGNFGDRLAERFKSIPELEDKILNQIQLISRTKHNNYSGGGIDRIYDTEEKYYLDPEKCVVATLIRQSKIGNILKLEIDQRLMVHPKHSKISANILFLHEAIYNWAIELGQKSSYNTRGFIATLLKKNIFRSEVLEMAKGFGFLDLKLRSREFDSTPEWKTYTKHIENITRKTLEQLKLIPEIQNENFIKNWEKIGHYFFFTDIIRDLIGMLENCVKNERCGFYLNNDDLDKLLDHKSDLMNRISNNKNSQEYYYRALKNHEYKNRAEKKEFKKAIEEFKMSIPKDENELEILKLQIDNITNPLQAKAAEAILIINKWKVEVLSQKIATEIEVIRLSINKTNWMPDFMKSLIVDRLKCDSTIILGNKYRKCHEEFQVDTVAFTSDAYITN